jgi:ribosomal-protein-alanine N-acetyltransferase
VYNVDDEPLAQDQEDLLSKPEPSHVQYTFSSMDPASARAISAWHYDPPYELYNVAPERIEKEVQALLDPQNAYYAMFDEGGSLVANCCFGRDAQVSGGDYSADALDIGLGVRPDQTGQGRGHTYVDAVLDLARHTYAPTAFRVTVAAFNGRALRVWGRAGFRPVSEFARTSDGLAFVVLTSQGRGVGDEVGLPSDL